MGKLFGGRKPDYTRVEAMQEQQVEEPKPEDLGLPPMPTPPMPPQPNPQLAQPAEDELLALMDYHLGKFLEYYQKARREI